MEKDEESLRGNLMKEYLIILSGWAVQQFVWRPILNLLENDYEVIIIDWNDVDSLDGFKQKVMTILRKKDINRFSIIGWSLGSLVAMDIVTSNSFKIDNLILISGTSKFIQDQTEKYNLGWHKKILHNMIYMLKKHPEETINKFYKNIFSKVEAKDGYYDRFSNEILYLNKKNSIDSLALGLEYLMLKDFRDKISQINIPVLLIHGDEDLICTMKASEYLQNHLRTSRLVIFTETGHMPFYIKPHKCYKIIKNFILNFEV
jgi:pimeloyl-[acyl-carrier protein] methyl ester esterase